jgi:hypothetical protein
LSFTFVLDVSDVAVFVSAIGNDLSAAIGEKNAVRSDHNFAVTFGFMGVVVLGWLVLNFPGEFVGHRRLLFNEFNQTYKIELALR